ncbi:hypothetical protein [Sphingobium yanoikuyae]|uniref:hypothetical protein n=1 Tax=Sphingobium yanoikuyae TaxID=13690 RepID=UPI002014A85D|nr:hypothetical protein [Sphingobium yanoikuyae]
MANGLVILGLYSDANPPPSNTPDVVQIDMPDGATIAYDHAAHALAVTLPAGGTATIAPPPRRRNHQRSRHDQRPARRQR